MSENSRWYRWTNVRHDTFAIGAYVITKEIGEGIDCASFIKRRRWPEPYGSGLRIEEVALDPDQIIYISGEIPLKAETDEPAVDIVLSVWIGKRQLAAMEAPQAAALMASLQDLFIVPDRIAKIEKGEVT